MKIVGCYKIEKNGGRSWPALKSVRRLSKVRLERLRIVLARLRAGKSIKEIAAELGYEPNRIYHEMYFLKKHGLLDSNFKNPASVYTDDLASTIEGGRSRGNKS